MLAVVAAKISRAQPLRREDVCKIGEMGSESSRGSGEVLDSEKWKIKKKGADDSFGKFRNMNYPNVETGSSWNGLLKRHRKA